MESEWYWNNLDLKKTLSVLPFRTYKKNFEEFRKSIDF